MIELFAFPPAFGLPSPGPFAIKSEIHLKMMDLPYRLRFDGRGEAPKGKLPYIVDGVKVVADSTFIRTYLEAKYGIDLDGGYDEHDRALAWSIERMVEDNLYWAMVHARWADDINFAAGPAHFFDDLQADVQDNARQKQRSKVLGYLDGQGMGRLSQDEIAEMTRRGYTALARLLGDKPYILGERPCGADASIFAQVASALIPPFASPVRNAVSEHANLVNYAARMMAAYYPEFA